MVTLWFAKPPCAGSIPAHASILFQLNEAELDYFCYNHFQLNIARVAELVYAHDLKSCLTRDTGSTPVPGTAEVCNNIANYFATAHSSAGRAVAS